MPNDVNDENVIQEAEIVEIPDENAEDQPNEKTAAFLNLEGLIKRYVKAINKLKEDLKEKRQMFEDTFENDAVYREHAENAKEANKIKSSTKQQIMKQPAMQELNQKIKDMKFDLTENEALLSDYLQQYQKATGATQIELEDGEILEIVNTVRLVRKSSRSDR